MEYAIILIKTKAEDTALEIAGRQICQLKDKAYQYNIAVVDCLLTCAGLADILKKLKSICETMAIDSVLIYEPKQVCKNVTEYNTFVDTLAKNYGIKVRALRY